MRSLVWQFAQALLSWAPDCMSAFMFAFAHAVVAFANGCEYGCVGVLCVLFCVCGVSNVVLMVSCMLTVVHLLQLVSLILASGINLMLKLSVCVSVK